MSDPSPLAAPVPPGARLTERPVTQLDRYARIPIAFEVREVFDGIPGRDGFTLHLRPVAKPWVKDYDQVVHPTSWPGHFDLSQWRMWLAHHGDRAVGGAVLAWGEAVAAMLGGRRDVAVLWDLRVAPELRGRGVGKALFAAAERWAAGRGCIGLRVETQNVNVPACRFYAARGCLLEQVRPHAYPDLPEEVQLIWRRDLTAAQHGGQDD